MTVVLPTPPAGYLDATAGQPLAPAAREVLVAAFDQAWADPQGQTPPSRQSRALLDGALDQMAALLGVRREQISIVSDEQGELLSRASGRLVHSAIERSEVLTAALSRPSVAIPVDRQGRINLELLRQEVKAGDSIYLQAANREVGTIQPLDEVAELAAERGAELFSDYSHSIGSVALIEGATIGVSAATWGGPSGVGIVISERQQHCPNISTPLVLAATAALESWLKDKSEDRRLRELIDQLRTSLSRIPDVDLVGDPVNRLPHILTASFLYVDGQRLMDELAREGIYVGSGSACSASRIEPSHVLAAMGSLTHGNIRVLLPRGVDARDLHKLGELLPGIVAKVRDDLR